MFYVDFLFFFCVVQNILRELIFLHGSKLYVGTESKQALNELKGQENRSRY